MDHKKIVINEGGKKGRIVIVIVFVVAAVTTTVSLKMSTNRFVVKEGANGRRGRWNRGGYDNHMRCRYCWFTGGARGSSTSRLEQPHKQERHHTLTQNLKTMGLWVLLLITCSTFTLLSVV
ncbi:transmembrane protein, putative [Medicago truncatula]|uniref:Transmembrane protein, putative n=1 Tax=Medicago truncatula TaxID=3880 RepID=A0A072VGZ5_MEDTR|nr:transmembrane protein, putative [Medicago truncatula]